MKTLTIALIVATLCSATQAQTPAIDNVVIVLDGSGSMNGRMTGADGSKIQKLEAAKLAIREVLKIVPQETQVGLLQFAAQGASSKWIYPLGPRNDTKLEAALKPLRPGGGTPLAEFTEKGANRLLKQMKEQYGYGTYRLLIVTDGEASDRNRLQPVVEETKRMRIYVDVIGVDMQKAHSMAPYVDSYRSANDPDSLTRAIKQVFSEVSTKGDQAAAEFDELAGFPPDVAVAWLNALQGQTKKTTEDAQVLEVTTEDNEGTFFFVTALLILLAIICIVTIFKRMGAHY